MAGFVRHLGAVLVAIALVASQVMPAWAGCHPQRHAKPARAMATTVDVAVTDASGHHGMSHAKMNVEQSLAAADQPQQSSNDMCLGNCGCACGLGGVFVPTSVTAIDVPHGMALTPDFALLDLPPGDRPDGPRRPPRTAA